MLHLAREYLAANRIGGMRRAMASSQEPFVHPCTVETSLLFARTGPASGNEMYTSLSEVTCTHNRAMSC